LAWGLADSDSPRTSFCTRVRGAQVWSAERKESAALLRRTGDMLPALLCIPATVVLRIWFSCVLPPSIFTPTSASGLSALISSMRENPTGKSRFSRRATVLIAPIASSMAPSIVEPLIVQACSQCGHTRSLLTRSSLDSGKEISASHSLHRKRNARMLDSSMKCLVWFVKADPPTPRLSQR